MDLPVSPKELERVHGDAYQGRGVEVMLCLNPGGLSLTSTTAEWAAAEVSGNGYARFTLASLGAGAWNAGQLRYESPEFAAAFEGTGAGFTYDTLVVVVDQAAYPYSVVATGMQTLASGTPRTYPVTIAQRSAV
jgi:hypothetical protein